MGRRKDAPPRSEQHTVYDTGALLAAEAGDAGMWVRHRRLTSGESSRPMVPAVVLAQSWRGGPQPLLSRLLRTCVIEEFSERRARAAGAAIAAARTHYIVDAAVVISAIEHRADIVTSDPGDLRRIADALGRRLELLRPKRWRLGRRRRLELAGAR